MPMLVLISMRWPLISKGLPMALDDAGGELLAALGVAHVGLDDGELVAAQARHQIALAHAVEQALAHLLQERVADGMAERIVDRP